MTFITFAQVIMVCLLGAISPGPSMAVVINNAIFKGRYNGILTSIGHGIGIAVYATFAVLGLGLIIKNNLFIFNSLKILSIIFLIIIGMKSILNNGKMNLEKKELKEKTISFLQGFSISILNPKIFVWFIAVYSQFMSINNQLILGSALFGAGWGLGRLCPGPAITSVALLNIYSITFVVSMFVGFYLVKSFNLSSSR